MSAETIEPLSELVETIQHALRLLAKQDAIHECGPAPLQIIQTRPDEVLLLAHQKLHTWKYSDVPRSWRRLYEEASLWKVLCLIEEHLQNAIDTKHMARGRKRKADGTESPIMKQTKQTCPHGSTHHHLPDDWLACVTHVLDMALILTGGPLRKDLIQNVFDQLQSFADDGHVRVGQGQLFDAFPSPSVAMPPGFVDTFTRTSRLSFVAFQQHLDADPKPIVIPGVMDDWPALADTRRNWQSPRYLEQATLGGRRLVPVELGRSYTDDAWSQKIMTFGEYMRKYLFKPKQDPTGYLAQHDLFDQIPSLGEDTRIPDYCYTNPPPPAASSASTVPVPELDDVLRNAWLGPAGTISPLHTDPYHNILCQVVGHKYIRLYPPSETPKLYPRGIDESGVNMENTSYIDIARARALYAEQGIDNAEAATADKLEFEARFPLFRDAKCIEGILGPGECLYIPVGWWHYVESLSTSFSMSFWWN